MKGEVLVCLESQLMSNDVLLGHIGERLSCYRKHVKECFPEADTGERMF